MLSSALAWGERRFTLSRGERLPREFSERVAVDALSSSGTLQATVRFA